LPKSKTKRRYKVDWLIYSQVLQTWEEVTMKKKQKEKKICIYNAV
jgi:hypothetical protein